MAFFIAAIVFAATLGFSFLIVLGNGMMDAPSVQATSPMPVLIKGTLIALVIAASHWLPHIGW